MFRMSLLAWIAVPPLLLSFAVAQSGEDRDSQIAAALREEQYDIALGMIHAALQDMPADPQLWTMQGVAYNGVGKTPEALRSFRHALKLSPDSVPALKGAAQIEYDQGDAAGIPAPCCRQPAQRIQERAAVRILTNCVCDDLRIRH